MTEVLFQPYAFFEKLRQRPPRVWAAYGVYLLATLLTAVASQLAVRALAAPVPMGNPWIWTLLGAPLAALVMWGIFGFVVMLISGAGSRAYEVVGWAAAPSVVAGLLLLVAAALFPVQGTVPPAPSDPALMAEWLKSYQAVVQASTFTQISRTLALLALLWSSWIVYAGLGVFARARAALGAGVYLLLQLGLYLLGNVRLGG